MGSRTSEIYETFKKPDDDFGEIFCPSRYCKKEKKLNNKKRKKRVIYSSVRSNRPFVNAVLSGVKVDLLVDSGADDKILNVHSDNTA